MEENNNIFESDYVEPNAEAKAALIKELQEGNFTLSFSALSAFAESPRQFIAYKLRERVTTPAMILGEAVHCLVLEPEEFNKRFYIAPDVNAATKDGRAAWVKMHEDFLGPMENEKMKKGEIVDAIYNASKVRIIDAKIYANAEMRARQIITNKASAFVLSKIESTELKVTTEIEGIKFRGVIDAYGETEKVIADIKNVPDATWTAAQRMVWTRALHWQAYIYDRSKDGGHDCYIIAVDPLGEVSVHGFAEHHLVKASREIGEYITRFKECIFLSHTEPEIWDSSQEFWLTSAFNPYGINYL